MKKPTREYLDFINGFVKHFDTPTDFKPKGKTPIVITSGKVGGGKYTIEYFDRIPDDKTGIFIDVDIRVGMNTGKIQVSKKLLIKREYPKEYIFFILIWCWYKFEGNKPRKATDGTIFKLLFATDQYCDTLAFKYIQKNFKNTKLKYIFLGMCHMAKHKLDDHNKNRVRNIALLLAPRKPKKKPIVKLSIPDYRPGKPKNSIKELAKKVPAHIKKKVAKQIANLKAKKKSKK